jgi:hypothetical protein
VTGSSLVNTVLNRQAPVLKDGLRRTRKVLLRGINLSSQDQRGENARDCNTEFCMCSFPISEIHV